MVLREHSAMVRLDREGSDARTCRSSAGNVLPVRSSTTSLDRGDRLSSVGIFCSRMVSFVRLGRYLRSEKSFTSSGAVNSVMPHRASVYTVLVLLTWISSRMEASIAASVNSTFSITPVTV